MKSVARLLLVVTVVTILPHIGVAQSIPRHRLPSPGLDGRFVALAHQLPGFGGYFFDADGDLNVYLTDVSRAAAATDALATVAQSRPQRVNRPWTRPAAIIARQGRFDFIQLDEWRRQITAGVTVADGVRSFDTDERSNQIVIGVRDEISATRVLAVIDRAGIPRLAVTVKIVPDVSPLASLSSYVRPVVAGLEITFVQSGSVKRCTLGANVSYSNAYVGVPVGTKGFFTATHCSVTEGNTEGTVFSQGGSPIAYELWDPPFFTSAENARCVVGRNCRWSDATFAAYYGGVSWQQGMIAQTLYAGTNLPGSLEINQNSPSFAVLQTALPVSGMVLEKIGRTTGWTSGTVKYTCEDRYVDAAGFAPWGRLCQDIVVAHSDSGDSGAPVFQQTGPTSAAFSGILWGGVTTAVDGDTYFMSNLDRIQWDFGYGLTFTP